ncbi:MAG: holo-ACP synthase [Actinomycetota bacterium]|nr:holo-ACP synthase [Actinomycetota bacterium]
MIVGVGVDVDEIARLDRALTRTPRLARRLFTAGELEARRPGSLAARFAAKEAVAKVLGTGLGDVAWREIEILANERGRPVLVLHGAAAARAARLGLRHWSVSLTHLAGLALALVVATAAGRETER